MGCASSREATADSDAPASRATNAVSKATQDMSKATQELASKVVSGLLNPTLAMNAIRPVMQQGEKLAQEGNRHLRNIFAKPLADILNFDSFEPPVHPKTDSEKDFIEVALKMNFVFQNLSRRSLEPLVMAFEKVSFEAKHTIIQQGDLVGDYFYIVDTGECEFLIDDKPVGKAGSGDSFGELALLYTCPRAATVRAIGPTTVYRVDQATFRYILRSDMEHLQGDKEKLLSKVDFLKDLTPQQLDKLVIVMTPLKFKKGDYLMKKGDKAEHFSMLKEGEAKATDISVGNTKYEDITIKAGDYFGERALVTGEKRAGNVVALTDGIAFQIDKDTFESVLGSLKDLILHSQDQLRLSGIKVIKDSCLDPLTMSSLAKLIADMEFKKGVKLTEKGKPGLAALYLVRKGKVEVTDASGTKTLERGAYFGDDLLLADMHASSSKQDPNKITATYTATVTEDCSVGVLTLASCRRVLNTRYLGKKAPTFDSLKDRGLNPDELKRHRILGAGTFGQVWLVSRTKSDGSTTAYALKVQSKYDLCQDGQAAAVVHEKNIMAELQNPFLISLVGSYQDEKCVFMLMELVQGGELSSVMRTPTSSYLSEKDAIFYTAVIAEGLGFMHRRGYVYRDLKPENVLVNDKGYCVIIDFGFVKKVRRKTYTLCGTPLYMAPEVILNRGHNWGADHWSLGVLVYEMLTGQIPFYREGMQQMDLFRAIVEGKFDAPGSANAKSLIKGFLTTDPSKRLGSLAGGEDDIIEHAWFSDIDFGKLRNQEIDAPYVPDIKDPLDSSNFEDWSFLKDKTKEEYPPLTKDQKAIFVNF